MNDEHGPSQALAISWSEPNLEGTAPAWDGPSPDAPRSRPTADAPAPEQAPAAPRGGISGAWESWTSAHPGSVAPGQASVAETKEPVGHPDQAEQAPPASAPVGWADAAARESTPAPAADSAPSTPQDDFAPAAELAAAPALTGTSHDEALDAPEPARPADAPQRTGSSAYVEPAAQDGPRGYDQSFMDQPVEEPKNWVPSESPLAVAPEPSPVAAAEPASLPESPATPAQAQPAFAEDPGSSAVSQNPAAEPSAAPPQVIGQNEDLPEDSLTIGRSRNNSIVLDDMLVSRRHVVITADEQGLLMRDLGSRNGTFVNGRRVEQTHLHEGDRIGIGASTFEVRDGWLVSV